LVKDSWITLVSSCKDHWRNLWQSPRSRQAAALLAAFTLTLLWAYGPTLTSMVQRWSNDPKYSHGFLVPVFAGVVLWVRRGQHRDIQLQLCAAGLVWLAGAALLRLVSAAIYLEWLDALSLLPALLGVCVLLGGTPALRWVWPAVVFLVFMMPAPYQLEVALAQPLQRMATACSTYFLQTFGLPAVAEGNVIWIDEVKLEVIEACSGLGMLITFFALSTAVALVLARGWAERAVLFLSALPIAVAANVARITLTGVLYVTAGRQAARIVYHDMAGWLMMPLALGMLWLELKFLEHLFLAHRPETPLPLRAERNAQSDQREVHSASPQDSALCAPSSTASGATL
jgi:exosortase